MADPDGDDGPQIQLVTRGDDAGVVPSANAAVHDAFLDGMLRNVSVMAPTPALGDAADRLAELDGLCVGVHLTLTAEWDYPRWGPVSPGGEVPSLVESDGTFPRDVEPLAETLVVDEAIREAEAQVERLREAGFEPFYLDTHMLASRIQGLDDALAKFCEREDLLYADRTVPAFLLEDGPGSPAERLEDQLDELDSGAHALVGHPCYDTLDAREIAGRGHAPGAVATDRDRQRQLFVDPDVEQACRRAGAIPSGYDDL